MTGTRLVKPAVPRASAHSSLVLTSGGVDSSACLAFTLSRGHAAETLFVDYGQRAAARERAAARRIARNYRVVHREVRCAGVRQKDPGYVRGRNAFLLMLALQEFRSRSGTIIIGVHAGTEYADCTGEFMDLVRRTADIYAAGEVALLAPFLSWSKREIWAYALKIGVPVEFTYSCELGELRPCGSCRSCRDRMACEAG